MRLWDAFIDALYPRGMNCCLCGRNARLDCCGLCPGCSKLLRPCGGAPAPRFLDGAVAGLIYEERARTMVHRFKYRGERYLGASLSGRIELPESWRDCALLPVPMHRDKERRRGYNQARLLADELAARYGLQVRADLLKRIRDTESQTKMAAKARAENLQGAFRASRNCRGLSIILVDDVLTTGSTASECAKTLKGAGAERVYLAAACLAPSIEDE